MLIENNRKPGVKVIDPHGVQELYTFRLRKSFVTDLDWAVKNNIKVYMSDVRQITPVDHVWPSGEMMWRMHDYMHLLKQPPSPKITVNEELFDL